MDDRAQRPSPAHSPDEPDSGGPPADRYRDGFDQQGQGAPAAPTWRAQGLDFVRDAISLTYR